MKKHGQRSFTHLYYFFSGGRTLLLYELFPTTFVTDMTKAPFHLIDLNAPSDESGIPQPVTKYVEGDEEGGGR